MGRMKTGVSLVMSLVCMMVLLGLSSAAWADPAEDLVKAKEKQVRAALKQNTKEGTPAHEAKREKIRGIINTFFDFEELGKRSLSVHWNERTDEERKQFLTKLQRLIENSYLDRIVGHADYQVRFMGARDMTDHKIVRMKIKSGKQVARVEFKLLEKEARWVVFDMMIDDVSLLENYRTQFSKIIRKKGFAEVLVKMDKKLSGQEDKDLGSAPGSGKTGK